MVNPNVKKGQPTPSERDLSAETLLVLGEAWSPPQRHQDIHTTYPIPQNPTMQDEATNRAAEKMIGFTAVE